MNKLESKHSTGYDDISTHTLKQLLPGIANPLSTLINRALSEGIFPTALKQAKVVPLHKGKETAEITNYRPISLLSSVSKVFEKFFHKRLYKFLEMKNILSSFQFGFRSKHSTIDAVTSFTKDILKCLENKSYTLAVFCDLSKAFDTLDHSILLHKLHKYGIRGSALNLLRSYLQGRRIFVRNGDVSSDIYEIPDFGVPQGSVLGPFFLFFFIYG